MIAIRMRQARLAAGLTLREFSKRLVEVGQSVTPQALSNYEQNKRTPNARFLIGFGQVLGVESSYFLHEPSGTIEWLTFRKRTTLTKAQQEQIKATVHDTAVQQAWLHTTLYPDRKPELPRRKKVSTLDQAERIAGQVRELWKLGDHPIDSVTRVIEDRGGIVIGWDKSKPVFDGLAGWVNDTFPVIVVSMAVPDDRRRYSLAHELGHLVMDCNGVPVEEEEKLACRFGAAFLVPEAVAKRELSQKRRHLDLYELGLLKEKHGLSMQAWARRAWDLGIIEQGYYQQICREFNQRGWRKTEPFAFEGREVPTRLKQMVLHALAEGIITRIQAENLCPGTIEQEETTKKSKRLFPSPRELMKLPKEDREKILAVSAELAAKDYNKDSVLTDFEAFGENDFYDETP